MSDVDTVELREWIDRHAIEQLIYRYSDAVTRADWDQLDTVFTADAVWESPPLGRRYEGPGAIREFLAKGSSALEILIQTPHCPVIRLLGPQSAQATTTLHEFTRGVIANTSAYGESGSGLNFEQYGIYFDDIAKLDGDWKFTRRLFVPVYVGPDCVTGQVIGPRTSLLPP